ncbi:hypothetical protein [Peptoniphilus indolicus]|nr:hypothetical protein [Peptoniphilus indolicus]
MCNSKLNLYHCNLDRIISKVIAEKSYNLMKSKGDKYWLGDGIYLWDNLSNAKYWKKDKERKCGNDIYSICELSVNLDYLLDFTDSDIRKYFEKIFEQVYLSNPAIRKAPLGIKINFLLNEYPERLSAYHVIKGYGIYNRVNTKLYKFRDISCPHLSPEPKAIYNVIDDRAILKVEKKVG